MQHLYHIFRYLKPYTFLAIVSPLMMVGEVTADLLLPFLMSYIVNYGIIGMNIYDTASGSRVAVGILEIFHGTDFSRMEIIITLGILMLAITLIGGFFGTFSAYTSAKAAQGLGYDLRCDAYKKIMNLSFEQTDSFTTGSLVTRMANDVALIIESFEFLLKGFVRSPMFLIGGTIMLLLLDIRFGLIILITVPILGIILTFVLSRAIPMYQTVQKRLDKVNSIVQENVSGARMVKAYNKESYEAARFSKANFNLRYINYRVLRLMAVIPPILTILLNLAIIFIIYIGGYNIAIENMGMSTGAIMAAITYATQIIQALLMVTNLFQMVSRGIASAKRVDEILCTEPVIIGGKQKPTEFNTDIAVEFRNVSFQYPNTRGKPILSHINLQVKRGETLAIIGSTGVGKSTLVSLIPRFYDVDEGEIFINGLPIKSYDLSSLRHKIAFVMQKSELFSATVAENIRWGKDKAFDKEVITAAKTAQAVEFINRFPQGFDTHVEEKGSSLSGGQKQRLSLARAFVRQPEILIMDDATSALDLATENKLQAALKATLHNTTVIMIAQRIASVQRADKIAVLEDDGTILHCAPHEQLLKISKTYQDIYHSQIKSGAYVTSGGGNFGR